MNLFTKIFCSTILILLVVVYLLSELHGLTFEQVIEQEGIALFCGGLFSAVIGYLAGK